jgi:hypothetical protein
MQEQLPSAYLLPTKTVRTSFGSKLHVGYAVRTFSGQTARGKLYLSLRQQTVRTAYPTRASAPADPLRRAGLKQPPTRKKGALICLSRTQALGALILIRAS